MGHNVSSPITQALVFKHLGGKTQELLEIIDADDMMDPDFKRLYHEIIECGMNAWGAAKAVDESGTTLRHRRTLYHHAKEITAHIIEYLSGMTPDSIVEELMTNKAVYCPAELMVEVRNRLKEDQVEYYVETVLKRGRQLR